MLLRVLLATLLPALAGAATFAIRDVTVIDGTGAAPKPHSTIVVRGDKIVALGPVAEVRIPKGALLINGRNRYLIPGLWDMHVHLWDKENVLPLYVARGITGVRDMGSDFERTSKWWKEIEAGRQIGPHVVTSGPAVDGRPSRDEKLPVLVAKTPEDGRRVYDQLSDMNVDFIKVLSGLPRDAFFALAERARHWGTPFAGHLPSGVTAREGIDARMNSMEHLFGLFVACSTEEDKIRAGKLPSDQTLTTFSDEKARDLFRRSALLETRQTPTLTLWERMSYNNAEQWINDPRQRSLPLAIRKTWPKPEEELKAAADPKLEEMRKQMVLAEKMVKLMQECGVEILAGTDTGDAFTVPGVTLHRELELLVHAGLTPMQALQSASVAATKYLGWEESVGALKKGMVADMVLLDGDPLADIANVRKVVGVSIRGRYLGPVSIGRILGAGK